MRLQDRSDGAAALFLVQSNDPRLRPARADLATIRNRPDLSPLDALVIRDDRGQRLTLTPVTAGRGRNRRTDLRRADRQYRQCLGAGAVGRRHPLAAGRSADRAERLPGGGRLMLASPLAPTTGWTWSLGAGRGPARRTQRRVPLDSGHGRPGRWPGKPEVKPEAVIGVGASPTALMIPFTGRVRHAASGSVHWIWGRAADLALYPTLLTRLPFGNPLIALRFTDPATAAADDFPSEGMVRATPVTLAGTTRSWCRIWRSWRYSRAGRDWTRWRCSARCARR